MSKPTFTKPRGPQTAHMPQESLWWGPRTLPRRVECVSKARAYQDAYNEGYNDGYAHGCVAIAAIGRGA